MREEDMERDEEFCEEDGRRIVGYCDECGGEIREYTDETLAAVSEDGRRSLLYCRYCTAKSRGMIVRMLAAAGIWYAVGYGEDVADEAQHEIWERRQHGGIPKKRLLIVQRGVRASDLRICGTAGWRSEEGGRVMKLYEINDAIETLLVALTVDPETGEIPLDADDVIAQLDALAMEKRFVLEYLAKVVLNLRADQAAVKAEEARLKDRRERMARREASVMAILDRECAGVKTDLGVATVSYRTSEATEITSEADARTWLMAEGHDECLKYEEPSIDKNALKKLIKSGVKVPGAAVETRINCSLK